MSFQSDIYINQIATKKKEVIIIIEWNEKRKSMEISTWKWNVGASITQLFCKKKINNIKIA